MSPSLASASASASASKRQKRRKKARTDRISSLPDDILIRILSFLPTKYAVGTSILNSRWRHLWTLVPSLDLDDSLVFDTKKSAAQGISSKVLFINFVDRVLIHRGVSRIQKFALKCTARYYDSHVWDWISTAISRDIEELDLCMSKEDGLILLPTSLYCCEKLVVLKLGRQVLLSVPDTVSFPCLKVLHLDSLQYLRNTDLEKLLTGSSVLEKLVIDRHPSDHLRTLDIHSSSLKSLAIRDHQDFSDCGYRVTINAPKVEFLELANNVSKKYDLMELSSLVKASFHVGSDLKFNMSQLLRQISNVKVLSLSSRALEALFNGFLPLLPSFHNLTRLEVTPPKTWWLLSNILVSTPKLEVLVINKMKEYPRCHKWYDDIGKQAFLKSLPPCLSSCLEVIEFTRFTGSALEMEMMEYFLINATLLKKMTISCFLASSEEKLDALKKLSMFRRNSTSCQIAFS